MQQLLLNLQKNKEIVRDVSSQLEKIMIKKCKNADLKAQLVT
jgi:lipoate-protein ligase B